MYLYYEVTLLYSFHLDLHLSDNLDKESTHRNNRRQLLTVSHLWCLYEQYVVADEYPLGYNHASSYEDAILFFFPHINECSINFGTIRYSARLDELRTLESKCIGRE
jgi:hypothetical protein